jgi:signal peptidase II
VGFGTYYILSIIRKQYHIGYIICVTLIYAGAIGNLVDSLFYGMAFEFSDAYAQNLAKGFWQEGFQGGYEGILHGRVVDMFYFPIIHDVSLPGWIPIWGGEPFEFFRPVFNLADASISIGLVCILIFQSRFFPGNSQNASTTTEEAA